MQKCIGYSPPSFYRYEIRNIGNDFVILPRTLVIFIILKHCDMIRGKLI